MDYNKQIYNFIVIQLKDIKYLYTRDFNVSMFKKLAEEHYDFAIFPINEWQLAFEWAVADVFGGGCDVETIDKALLRAEGR